MRLSSTPHQAETISSDRHDSTISLLRRIDLFDGLSPSDIGRLARAFTLFGAGPGQYLEVQDAPVLWWSVMVNGHALVERDRTALALLGHGESWSEHSVLNTMRSPISVVALSPVSVLSVTRRQFWEILDDQPTLRKRITARSATSPDRLALPVHRALVHMDRALLRPSDDRALRWA
ncbi:MAG TPA: cyclic nucleotide-binding domain-containing protein [Acidimicrobiales bacterium]|nr:cyclic nucleotide-binding domain-containing protein [Acidimicrobiales bacterium]